MALDFVEHMVAQDGAGNTLCKAIMTWPSCAKASTLAKNIRKEGQEESKMMESLNPCGDELMIAAETL